MNEEELIKISYYLQWTAEDEFRSLAAYIAYLADISVSLCRRQQGEQVLAGVDIV